MESTTLLTSSQSEQCLINKPVCRIVIIVLLFAAAFGVRLYHITKPPMDFASIRQYQNAHIIRGLYYETNDLISESRKRIAKLNMERMGLVMEPRLIENASVLGYRIIGAEHLWVPRVLSVLFWIVGGIFLYLIARMFFSPAVSLLTCFFFLFLPYGILASRGIQPDALMVMMMLFSVHWVLKYDNDPARMNLFVAAGVAAFAVLIKPYCVFMIFGVFFSLAVIRAGFWKAAFNRNSIIFTCILIAPAIVYYSYRLFANVGFLGVHARGSFLPHLLIYPPFWRGWLQMIVDVIGYVALFLAMAGLFKAGKGRPRALLAGLWIGYVFLGLSATYQIHTHSYYSMPLIPIVALSMAPVADMVVKRYNFMVPGRKNIMVIAVVLSMTVLAFGLGMNRVQLRNAAAGHKEELKQLFTFIGVNPQISHFLKDDFDEKVRVAKEIGDIVGHSTNNVLLTPDFGRIIAYHGELSGLPWPTSKALYGRRMRGTDVPNIEKDFTAQYIKLLYQGKFIEYTPDFFIITAFDEFEKQTSLKKILYENYPLLAQNDNYLIFDLRKMAESR